MLTSRITSFFPKVSNQRHKLNNMIEANRFREQSLIARTEEAERVNERKRALSDAEAANDSNDDDDDDDDDDTGDVEVSS